MCYPKHNLYFASKLTASHPLGRIFGKGSRDGETFRKECLEKVQRTVNPGDVHDSESQSFVQLDIHECTRTPGRRNKNHYCLQPLLAVNEPVFYLRLVDIVKPHLTLSLLLYFLRMLLLDLSNECGK